MDRDHAVQPSLGILQHQHFFNQAFALHPHHHHENSLWNAGNVAGARG